MGLLNVAIKGVAWSSLSTVVRSIVSLLQVSILTRYLEKSDFGIVAIATLFIGFIQIFMDLGLSIGIIHKQDISQKQYSSLFWFNVLSGLVLTIILVALSPVVARLYDEPALTQILALLSLNIFFSSLGNQHRTVQQKNLRFKYISIIEIVTSLATLALAVLLVRNGFGIYSLVYSTIFNILFSNLLFLILGLYADKNISFYFRLKEIRPFMKIGAFSVGAQVLDYFSREIDIILISATLGKDTLGLYSLCKKLVLSIYSAINPILLKVLAPLLAMLQNDINHLRKVYYDIIETISIVNFPIYFLIAIFSYGIIKFLYGETYVEGAPVLSLLAIYYGYLSTVSPVGSLQTALGRTDTGFYWTIFRTILSVVAIYIGSRWGLVGIVTSLLVMSFLSSPILWLVTIRPLIYGDFMSYFMKSFKSLICTCVLSLPFYGLCKSFTSLPLILFMCVLFVICYIIPLFVFFRDTYIVGLSYKYISFLGKK